MYCIPKWVKNCCYFVTYKIIQFECISSRNNNVLCKTTLDINTYSFCIPTKMTFPCSAVTTMAACKMPLTRYSVSFIKTNNLISHCFNCSYKLMTSNHWNRNCHLRPGIPVINVYICTTNSSNFNFY